MARKMKNSGIEWIGDIPEDWEVTRIKYIAKADSSGLSLDKLLDDGNFEVYDANSLVGYINHKPVKENYISIIKDGAGIGRTKLMPKNTNVIGTMNYISAKDVNLHYLFYALQVFDFEQYSTGSTIPHIYFKDYGNEYIALPNQEVQKNIVKALNDKVEKIDRLINTVKQEIQTLEDYKKSVITEAVTKGLDKNAAMKDSGIEWIGDIPKHWEVIKLKYEAEKIAKGISPKYVEEELTPVINQATFSKGYFDNNLNYCSDKPIGDGLLQKNDVLLATTGGGVLGKCFFFEEDGKYLASTDVAFIRCKDKAVAKFIYYIFSVSYQLFNGIYAKGATNQTHLQMNMLSNMQLPLPSDKELEDIILFLDKMSGKIDDAIAGKQKQLETLEEYKKSLIYEYVTGKKEVAEC